MATTGQTDDSIGFRDLGVPRSLLTASALGLALSAASAVLLLGGPAEAAIGASTASLGIAVACVRLVKQRMRGSLREPVAALLRTLDQVRLGGAASELPEEGAPLLQPLLRRFHLAQAAMEQRSQKTVANLMHAEAAFDRVHAVLQSLREGVVVVDTKERIVLMNRNARRVLELGERRAEAEPLFSLCTGALATAMRDGLQRLDAQRTGEVRIGDIAHEGRVYDLSIVQVQSNRPEQDYGKVLVLADVTQSHEVNRLKDELLSSISHELRTPLTNMICSSEILTTLTPSDEAEWREFANMLATESKRLKSLVDDIMEYGLLETGRVEWNAEPQSLAELAHTAASVLRNAAQLKRQSIECAIGDDAIAMVDPRRMREALCRILDNAVKFSPEGGSIRIALTTHAGVAELAIEDDGPGIPADDRERVFERFQQLGDVMTEKPQGTGLGLAIVRRIVAAAQGTVRCEASAAGGARFVVRLPIAAATLR